MHGIYFISGCVILFGDSANCCRFQSLFVVMFDGLMLSTPSGESDCSSELLREQAKVRSANQRCSLYACADSCARHFAMKPKIWTKVGTAAMPSNARLLRIKDKLARFLNFKTNNLLLSLSLLYF